MMVINNEYIYVLNWRLGVADVNKKGKKLNIIKIYIFNIEIL